MQSLGRTLGYALAGVVALCMAAPPVAAQPSAGNYKIIKRIGGRTSSICAPLRGTRDLKRMGENAQIQQDLRNVLTEAGLCGHLRRSPGRAQERQPVGRARGRVPHRWPAGMDGPPASGQGHDPAHGAVGRHPADSLVRVRRAIGRPRLHLPDAAPVRQPVVGELARVASAAPAADAGRSWRRLRHRRRPRRLPRRHRPLWPRRSRHRRHRRLRPRRSSRHFSRPTSARNVACAMSSSGAGARRCSV